MTAMYSLLNRMDLPMHAVKENPDGISVWLFGFLAVASGVVAMLGGKVFKNISNGTVSELGIAYMGATLTVKGMTDTGNLLKDPISGRPVVIIDDSVLGEILSQKCIACALKGDISGIILENRFHPVRLIRMKTAVGESMVCAFAPEKITLTVVNKKGRADGRVISVNALFAPAKLSFPPEKSALGCKALIPADIRG